MANVRFLKENEKSQKKNYKPLTPKLRFWKIISLLEGLIILFLIYSKLTT